MSLSASVSLNHFFSNSKAYLIAVKDYQSPIPRLISPENDVNRLKQVLAEKHGFIIENFPDSQPQLDICNPLVNPTKAQLLQFLANIKVEQSDRVILYFAGHGVASDSDDEPEGYLLAADATPGVYSSFISMREVMEQLNQLNCRHLLIILDCCYAGSFRWSEQTRSLGRQVPKTIYYERLQQYASNKAWQVLTSAAHDQKAIDVLRLGQREKPDGSSELSPFAAKLIEALETGQADLTYGATPADGIITATELSFYLDDTIFKKLRNADIEAKDRQRPMLFPLKKHGKGEFIFLNPAKASNGSVQLNHQTNKNPYKGLSSYRVKDNSIFYGRTRVLGKVWEVDHKKNNNLNEEENKKNNNLNEEENKKNNNLNEEVKKNDLVIVTGPSGIGKSSLVKAGVLSKYKYKENQKVFAKRPGKTPYDTHKKMLEYALQAEDQKIFLIDQYEELITLCESADQRKAFEESLLKLLPKHKVIITIRSDFEAHFKDSPLFVKDNNLFSSCRFIVPPFTREEIKEIVTQPALQEVLEFKSIEGTLEANEQFVNIWCPPKLGQAVKV